MRLLMLFAVQLLSVLEHSLSKLARYDQSSLFSSILSLTVSSPTRTTHTHTHTHTHTYMQVLQFTLYIVTCRRRIIAADNNDCEVRVFLSLRPR